jgi:hypothetical protein
MKKLITLLLVLVSISGYSQNYKPTDKLEYFDSSNILYMEKLIAKRVNMYRKELGLKPLIWNDTLKPMTDHHSYYMLHNTHEHITHTQENDLPNFQEMGFHFFRQGLNQVQYSNLGRNGIREELAEGLVFFGYKILTYMDYAIYVVDGSFKKSDTHWAALMDPKLLDYIFVDVVTSLKYKIGDGGAATICTIVMADKDDKCILSFKGEKYENSPFYWKNNK